MILLECWCVTVNVNTCIGLIREGSNHWECGKFINEAADGLFNTAIMPNLIWRVSILFGLLYAIVVHWYAQPTMSCILYG